jgi:phospholipase D1/2
VQAVRHPEVNVKRAGGAKRATSKTKRRKLMWQLAIGASIAGLLALVWKVTPLSKLRPEQIAQWLETFEKLGWAPGVFIAAYVVGGLVMFPVTLLGAASAIVFPPLKAVSVTFTGIMLSAALTYAIGAKVLGDRAGKRLAPIVEKVKEQLTDQGVITIAALRMVPLAPFTLVNIAAGCIGVRFRDFMLGTALGIAPGMTLVVLFGRQVRAFWKDPSASAVLLVVGVCVVWISVSLTLQRLVARRSARSGHRRRASA